MKEEEKLTEGIDYSVEVGGQWVFTANYHLKRGYCCQSGCQNCPYGNGPPGARLRQVFDYHIGSKHHFHSYAPGPGYMDWATQPDPFRRYQGAAINQLAKIPPGASPSYQEVLSGKSLVSPVRLDAQSLSQLFNDSLALSAWKSYQGNKWALRVNPSSGNLHPTEGYMISGPIPGLLEQASVCHYIPKEHALEIRATIPAQLWQEISGRIPEGSLFIALSSIHWREAWKYGERAFRYCQHDVGHALAALGISAATLGWSLRLLDVLSTEDLSILLGLPLLQHDEIEEPDCLLLVTPHRAVNGGEYNDPAAVFSEEIIKGFQGFSWLGNANRLSPSHEKWPMIDDVSLASRKIRTVASWPEDPAHSPDLEKPEENERADVLSIRKIIHQRRSAVDFDGKSAISVEAFYGFLNRTSDTLDSGARKDLFKMIPWEPQVHLAVFIHRVTGLDPGLYFYVRHPSYTSDLRTAMKPEFLWEKPDSCPSNLSFFKLLGGDIRSVAKTVSCNQDIAADGCFSLGMIAHFENPLREKGPYFYRRLFWETGIVGQVLYLEAESIGIRATGIGCFFDDAMHELLGIQDLRFQSLYHFTVGYPVEDTRLTSLPAYSDVVLRTKESDESTRQVKTILS